MEANTVIISTEEYNRMRDFNSAMRENYIVGVLDDNMVLYCKEEFNEKTINKIKSLKKALKESIQSNRVHRVKTHNLEGEINAIKYHNRKLMSINADLKNMSLFQLIKWKLKN